MVSHARIASRSGGCGRRGLTVASRLQQLAALPGSAHLRRLVNAIAGDGPHVVRVLTGPARGARLELDLAHEKSYWLGSYEPEIQALLQETVRPGDVVFDVGANVGFFSVLAARLGAKVYAFEPVPQNASRIARNAARNGLDIEVVPAAVWDSADGVALVPGESLSEWHAEGGGGILSITLDDFIRTHDAPDVLKIDVEGAEGRVLRGAAALLELRPRLVVCETHGEAALAEVRALLAGWQIETVGVASRLAAR